jgi:lipopolysaccharide export system protein LptA
VPIATALTPIYMSTQRFAKFLSNGYVLGRLVLGLFFCGHCAITLAETLDKQKPLTIDAEKMVYDEGAQTNTFHGNVIMTQGSLRIEADSLIFKQDKAGKSSAQAKGNATTPARFRRKLDKGEDWIEGSANSIDYDNQVDKVTLSGSANIKRGNDSIQGESIVYDGKLDKLEVKGGNTYPGSSRVRAVFQPR